MLGRIPDAIMLAIGAFCMSAACHAQLGLQGQGVYVAVSGGLALLCALAAIDCWFGFAAFLRLAGRKD